jgi:hypothetical protein
MASRDAVFLSENGSTDSSGRGKESFIPSSIPSGSPPNAAIHPLWMDLQIPGSAP